MAFVLASSAYRDGQTIDGRFTCDGADRPLGKALRNEFGRLGYGGPCPSVGHGPHRCFFTLDAVDVPSLMLEGGIRKALERVLQPHTLGTARLMGRDARSERGRTP